MYTPLEIIRSFRSVAVLALLASWAAFGLLADQLSAATRIESSLAVIRGGASVTPDCGVETLLGIPIYPGSELIDLEGPTLELVDLQRPGWDFVTAEIVMANFLVSDSLADLRRYYRPLCVRDPLLLLVKADEIAGEIIAVRYAGRHPLHPGKRWLRIIAYRLLAVPETYTQRDGE